MIQNGNKATIKVIAIFLMVSAIIIFLVPFSDTSLASKIKPEDKNSDYKKLSAEDLVIPTKDSILRDGFPTNENGETYGPDMGNLLLVQPDLQLAEGENGVLGYIREPKGISSPSELDEYEPPKSTPLYLQDGKTIIGTFRIGN